MYLCARGIVVASEQSCICVLGESMLLVIDYVFVCKGNRCCLRAVMYLCASGIVVACEQSCICC